MPSRRQFLKGVGGASAGLFTSASCNTLLSTSASAAEPTRALKHKPVIVRGRKIRTVDVHGHVNVREVAALLIGTPLEGAARPTPGAVTDPGGAGLGAERLQKMDAMGIDVQAISINPFWYAADRSLASRLINLQNQKLAEMCAVHSDRFVGFATVALQFPDLAAQQLDEALKLGLKGVAIGGSVEGEELSLPKYDPFWAKAEEIQIPIFMHPQPSVGANIAGRRLRGIGALGNAIGAPVETAVFLSHMIFEGVFDRFPHLKLCCAHGGGYLVSYADRIDHGCDVFPGDCKGISLKKKPTEYLKQIYVDSLVFEPEALRHLVAVIGADHIMLGTDYPFPWTSTPVDQVFATPGLRDSDRVAMLGGTACKWLGISAG